MCLSVQRKNDFPFTVARLVILSQKNDLPDEVPTPASRSRFRDEETRSRQRKSSCELNRFDGSGMLASLVDDVRTSDEQRIERADRFGVFLGIR